MKKIHLSAVAALALFASAGAAVAAEPASAYSYELGLTSHHETYKELDRFGDKLMQETAPLVGIKGSVSRAFGEHGKVKVSGEYAFGQSHYVGSYQGGSYGDVHAGGIGRELFETTAIYTHAAPEWGGVALSGGLGYRYLVDNLQDAGAGGYERVNQRIYAIVGIEHTLQGASWAVTPAFQYKHSLKSRHDSDLLGGIRHRQHGNGGELSVAFAQTKGDYPVTIRPFVREWRIDDSNVVDGFIEPKNRTREVGFDLAWRF